MSQLQCTFQENRTEKKEDREPLMKERVALLPLLKTRSRFPEVCFLGSRSEVKNGKSLGSLGVVSNKTWFAVSQKVKKWLIMLGFSEIVK